MIGYGAPSNFILRNGVTFVARQRRNDTAHDHGPADPARRKFPIDGAGLAALVLAVAGEIEAISDPISGKLPI